MPQTTRKRLVFISAAFWLAILGVVAIALTPVWPAIARAAGGADLHAPRFELIARESLQVQIHIIAAVAAFIVGLVILSQRKGSRFHRIAGWAWVVAMTITAASSLFITGLNGDAYSFIHLLTGWTLVALPMGVWAIRQRNVKMHMRTMTGMFVGGLVIAGAFTFLPGRLLWNVFFG